MVVPDWGTTVWSLISAFVGEFACFVDLRHFVFFDMSEGGVAA